jgi:hypothetical protein
MSVPEGRTPALGHSHIPFMWTVSLQSTSLTWTTRNNLLRRLTGSRWRANPNVLRLTTQALCFSTAEYACPVCNRSAHTNQVDTALNETCRIVTGCMKPTPLPNLYRAAGFAAPTSRRKTAEHREDQANCRWAVRTLRSQNTTKKVKIAE